MINLTLASLFLPLSHFRIASTGLRAVLLRHLGETGYTRAYSLLAVASLGWLIWAYELTPVRLLWAAPVWTVYVLAPVILVSGILAVGGLSTPNPVIVRSERLFAQSDIVRGVLRVTRNPFFWGAGLFALAQIAVLGTLAAMLSFGSVAVLGIAGAPILDAKKARKHGGAWEAFASATSDIPFLAIIQGRQRLSLREIGWRRMAIGAGLCFATLLGDQMRR